jgi:hypothetical protein
MHSHSTKSSKSAKSTAPTVSPTQRITIRPVLSIQYLADIRADILADIWSPHHSSTPKVLNIGQKYRHWLKDSHFFPIFCRYSEWVSLPSEWGGGSSKPKNNKYDLYFILQKQHTNNTLRRYSST